MDHHPIILFDGVCNYCNNMVKYVVKNDPDKNFRFAPLQSETGARLRAEYGVAPEVDSVVLIDKGKAYTLSTAALRINTYLKWPAKAIAALLIVPTFLRNPIYKWVAKNRYKWWGKKEECMIPGPDVRDRFLN